MAATTDPDPAAELVFRDRAVYLPDADALVCADLHVGRDATSGVELPLGEREDLVERLETLVETFDPGTVALAGDVLHAFDELPEGVAETVDALAAAATAGGADLAVARGNHDTMLDAVWDGPASETVRLDDGRTAVCHGHEDPEADADLYVIGHDHPAIRIEGRKRPCFLYRSRDGAADVLALPAFNRVARGTVINRARRGDMQSPLLPRPGELRPIVRDEDGDETLWFPPLSELRSYL